jgi:hypothetical protein
VKQCRDLFVRISSGFTGVPQTKTQLRWLENGAIAGKEKSFRIMKDIYTSYISIHGSGKKA